DQVEPAGDHRGGIDDVASMELDIRIDPAGTGDRVRLRVQTDHAAPAVILHVVGRPTPAAPDVEEELFGPPGLVPQCEFDRLFFPRVGVITLPDQREELLTGKG